MGAGCTRSGRAYKLHTDLSDEACMDPPSSPNMSSPSAQSTTPTVAELKGRLKELGVRLPATLMEKSELLKLVKDSELEKARRDSTKSPTKVQKGPETPLVTPVTKTRSVAEMKRRLRELGFQVPSSIVEKSELKVLVEEAERQVSNKQNRTGPSAPAPPLVSFKVGSHLQEICAPVLSSSVNERELLLLLEQAGKKEPSVEFDSPLEDGIKLTCTWGTQGVARIALTAAELSGSQPKVSSDNATDNVEGSTVKWVRGDYIGHGSFGRVFRALNPMTGELIAVKEVHLDLRSKSDQNLKDVLENEIDVIRSLRHPNIVGYLGCDWIGSSLYMYLEYMPGGSLASVLDRFGPLEECLIADYTRQLLLGLEYLHTRNPYVVHRDIKGANVLVGIDSLVKLADFGCSKKAKETMSFAIGGSIPWMAPEVIAHSRYGRACDIWSFGCLIIEMATAAPPWGEFDNIISAMIKIGMSGETPPVPDTLSKKCRNFLLRCLQHEASRRLSSSELLCEDFLQNPVLEEADDADNKACKANTLQSDDSGQVPDGWEKHFDPQYQAFYYWHKASGRSLWHRPPTFSGEHEEDDALQ